MSEQALLVLTTFASDAEARTFVRGLVKDRLVACGTVLSGATSIYRWEGAVTEDGEAVVLLKTTAARWLGLVDAVRARHPYQVPELLALPVAHGLDRYLAWVREGVAD